MLLLLLFSLLLRGYEINGLPYDFSASVECLAEPQKPQYGGGIIVNPELNYKLKGWSTFGYAKIEHRKLGDNQFVVAHSRNQSYGSVSQKLYLLESKLYTFSAWIQVSDGKEAVKAIMKTKSGFQHVGTTIAKSKCWSMIKGGLTVDESGPAELHFESMNTSIEIWVDSISLHPFTQEEWATHQEQSIEKARKRSVRIQAVDAQGNPLPNATISLTQNGMKFPVGCAINKNILNNQAYQNWFTSRFTVTTFENEMKWYSNENDQGKEDYSTSDAMLKFAQQHNIHVRGHNVLWDDPQYQPWWEKNLSGNQLAEAAKKRINSVISRYKNQLIHWDVVNENLHFSFFEDKVEKTASGLYYSMAKSLDDKTIMFMNDYNTIEVSTDGKSSPAAYLEKMKEILQYPGADKGSGLGIGLESHFTKTPDLAYIRASLDTLGAANSPIWLTEVDVQDNGNKDEQAKNLESVLREAYAHPKINGIVIWGAWKPEGCYRMCLTDNNFNNLLTGNVVDKLLNEWKGQTLEGKTDINGVFQASLTHGDYHVEIKHPTLLSSSIFQSFEVVSAADDDTHQSSLLFQVSA